MIKLSRSNLQTAKVISVYKREIKVEFDNGKRQRIPNGQYFKSQVEAEQHCYRVANDAWRRECVNRLLNDPPEQLLPNFRPRITGNPLRFAERNMMFVAQSNVWGSEVNEQKIIQVIAMTFEDIEMLIGMLEILAFMNDYAKKLIGKYFVVELNSIFGLLSKLKDLNKEYAQLEYQDMLKEIDRLEKKYKFRFIRDKIAAHKDSNIDLKSYINIWNAINYISLNEYWTMFVTHVDKVLMKYYPNEKKIYFLMRQQPLEGAIATTSKGNEYIPFFGFEIIGCPQGRGVVAGHR